MEIDPYAELISKHIVYSRHRSEGDYSLLANTSWEKSQVFGNFY